jgi:ketosteroid isomerase-like protein
MKKFTLFFFVFTLLSSSLLFAQETEASKADHEALRSMLTDGVKAINDHQIEDIVKFFHPDINVIFPNMEVADGVDAVRDYYSKMLGKSTSILKDISTEASADVLSEIYGNTAVVYGSMFTHYTFAGGMKLEIPTKWTITLLKENGNWKVISMQFTANLFNNPLLSKASSSAIYFGIGGLLLGLIFGFLIFRFLRKKSA